MEGRASVAMAYRALEERPGFLDIRVRFRSYPSFTFHACGLLRCTGVALWIEEKKRKVLAPYMAYADLSVIYYRQKGESMRHGLKNKARFQETSQPGKIRQQALL